MLQWRNDLCVPINLFIHKFSTVHKIGENPFNLSNSENSFTFTEKQILILKELFVNFQVARRNLDLNSNQKSKVVLQNSALWLLIVSYFVSMNKDVNEKAHIHIHDILGKDRAVVICSSHLSGVVLGSLSQVSSRVLSDVVPNHNSNRQKNVYN